MQTSGASRREIANVYLELEHRHCERSEAIHSFLCGEMDCVASLAMTVSTAPHPSRHRPPMGPRNARPDDRLRIEPESRDSGFALARAPE